MITVKTTETMKQEMRELYESGLSMDKIGKELGVGSGTVGYHLKKMKIKIRDRMPPKPYANFFKNITTPEQAWILGWIYSDGHLEESGWGHHGIAWELQARDIDVLIKIKEIMGATQTIQDRNSHGFPRKKIMINSIQMIEDLNRIGIPSGAKSSIITPLDLPDKLMLHFWRGVWEGDGSIGVYNGYPRLVITGNYETCQGFKEYMEWPNKISQNGPSFDIRKETAKKETLKEWYNKLFDDYTVENKLYLNRKFKAFQNVLSGL